MSSRATTQLSQYGRSGSAAMAALSRARKASSFFQRIVIGVDTCGFGSTIVQVVSSLNSRLAS